MNWGVVRLEIILLYYFKSHLYRGNTPSIIKTGVLSAYCSMNSLTTSVQVYSTLHLGQTPRSHSLLLIL